MNLEQSYINKIKKHFKENNNFTFALDDNIYKIKYLKELKKIVEKIHRIEPEKITVIEVDNYTQLIKLILFCEYKKYIKMLEFIDNNLK